MEAHLESLGRLLVGGMREVDIVHAEQLVATLQLGAQISRAAGQYEGHIDALAILAANDVEAQALGSLLDGDGARFSVGIDRVYIVCGNVETKRSVLSYLVISSVLTARGVPGGTAASTFVEAYREPGSKVVIRNCCVLCSRFIIDGFRCTLNG